MLEVAPNSLLPVIEVADPETAKKQLPRAEAELREKTAEREKREAVLVERQAQLDEDEQAANFLYNRLNEKSAALQKLRESVTSELLTLRDASDVSGHAQRIRIAKDELALYQESYSRLLEVVRPKHELRKLGDLARLHDSLASEADIKAILSHVRTIVALEPAFSEETRLGVVGQRTQMLLAEAKRLHEQAARTRTEFEAATKQFEKTQGEIAHLRILG
jgi:hypothetical protein